MTTWRCVYGGDPPDGGPPGGGPLYCDGGISSGELPVPPGPLGPPGLQ